MGDVREATDRSEVKEIVVTRERLRTVFSLTFPGAWKPWVEEFIEKAFEVSDVFVRDPIEKSSAPSKETTQLGPAEEDWFTDPILNEARILLNDATDLLGNHRPDAARRIDDAFKRLMRKPSPVAPTPIGGGDIWDQVAAESTLIQAYMDHRQKPQEIQDGSYWFAKRVVEDYTCWLRNSGYFDAVKATSGNAEPVTLTDGDVSGGTPK